MTETNSPVSIAKSYGLQTPRLCLKTVQKVRSELEYIGKENKNVIVPEKKDSPFVKEI